MNIVSGVILLACTFDFGLAQAVIQRGESVKIHIGSRTKPLVQPRVISARNAMKKEVNATLNVKMAVVDIERPEESGGKIITKQDKVRVRTYNGTMIASAIRVPAGDLLRITLNNQIPKAQPDKPHVKNKPNGFNITNLHTHGLHVSPKGRSDNVYLEIGPEDSAAFCFDVLKTHVAGTFWFHAHRHGSTALQLSSGMAGALIVDPGSAGGIDDVPEIRAAMQEGREKIFVFQQLQYRLGKDGIGEVTEEDVYGGKPQYRVTLINGTYAPVIELKAGEVQRWRCVHGGIDSTLNLAVGKIAAQGSDVVQPWDLHEIAADGLPLNEIAVRKSIELQPGYRSDFLVKAPAEEGEYILTSTTVPLVRAFRKVTQPLMPLARICVKGKTVPPMQLPKAGSIAKYAPRPIDDAELFNRIPFELKFKADGAVFTINGQEFDRDRDDVCPRLGTAEEWVLKSELDRHPFHIHVNPFEVVEKDRQGKIVSRKWRDTVFFTEDDEKPTYVRMRFEDFPGKTVLHCHNLVHEDQGMMMVVRIVGQDKDSRCEPSKPPGFSALPVMAPPWSLRDAEQRLHRLTDVGNDHILIFFRGLGCAHCRSQLDALATCRKRLGDTNVKVIAICPDSCESMRRVLLEDTAARALPFALLSDEAMVSFRQYGCYDGRALHGTFLVDVNGAVRWQHVGDDPYMDVNELLNRCRQVFAERIPANAKAPPK